MSSADYCCFTSSLRYSQPMHRELLIIPHGVYLISIQLGKGIVEIGED